MVSLIPCLSALVKPSSLPEIPNLLVYIRVFAISPHTEAGVPPTRPLLFNRHQPRSAFAPVGNSYILAAACGGKYFFCVETQISGSGFHNPSMFHLLV